MSGKKFLFNLMFLTVALSIIIDCNARGAAKKAMIVSQKQTEGAFCLVHSGNAAVIYTDPNDAEVVQIAAEALCKDIEMVTGILPAVRKNSDKLSAHAVIIGTLGQSGLIDRLADKGLIPAENIRGKWETFVVTVVERPFPDVERALVVAGSDRRGTAFGVFELSGMMGISPWVWWADVTPKHMDAAYIASGTIIEGPPSVRYRGIFLNDEDWGLQPWAAKNMDMDIRDIGPNTYAKIFELLLRMKGNYIWPAMHPCTKAFYYYPENPKTADRYAIVVGSTHCEPMLRNNVFEWSENFENEYGRKPGEWRYDTNRQQIYRYWEDRVKQSSSYESVYTVGMRGIHDSGMPGPRSRSEKIKLLEEVISQQRGLLSEYLKKPLNEIPQIFCPYKEVLTLYQEGLKLPDDVTIVWADDNHGYIRQLSNPTEQIRSGASGVYYHLSYWGSPHDYLWLSSMSPSLVSYEMTKAFRYGASRLWVFNVGDIKPAEMETEFALSLAWDVDSWVPENAYQYLRFWAAKTFGEEFAEPIAEIKGEYYRLAQEGKPEHMGAVTFDEKQADERLRDYQAIAAKAEALSKKIPERLQDAYFQLVLYPVRGACLMNEKILYARKSVRLAQQGNEGALEYTQKAQSAFEQIQSLTRKYNEDISGGKWLEMMSWRPRDLDVFKMPQVATAEMIKKAAENIAAGNEEQSKRIEISAADYTSKREVPPVSLQVIKGLGIGGKGLTIAPIDAESVPEEKIEEAVFVEYKTSLSAGDRAITVKCLPTHRIHEGRNLRYAISVNGETPRVVDVYSPADSRPWRNNVLRGYSEGRTNHRIDTSGESVVRIYILDPGLVINSIEVF
ncbi:MAG: glycosyl hydrolase 115 family protein [Sedimentisphaerales bacterium]|nr:glycosyl hydrolase 115 family protein [Sedimentisphaerales bacterium]